MGEVMLKMLDSWSRKEGNVSRTDELLEWIRELEASTYVNVRETKITDDSFWFYDDYKGEILNRKRSFFSIMGTRYFVNGEFVAEQPIIIQREIGYLGIIIKEIGGVFNFLMQAKIEPGNVNHIQISPTIQATKSNFTRMHGGRLPYYFEYFENAGKCGRILYDQIQSEQGSRFDGKRNRNMLLLVEDEVETYPNYKWMTLGQLKELMKIDNLVNMDTRTVLSGIPFATCRCSEEEMEKAGHFFQDQALYGSIFGTGADASLPYVTSAVNDYKMFQDVQRTVLPLNQLASWKADEYGIACKGQADFTVRYYDIEISGREVQHWSQPLFRAEREALFVLFTKVEKGIRRFLVSLRPEIGSFDKAELGPSLQLSGAAESLADRLLYGIWAEHEKKQAGILKDVVLSEEGGRFYHEQNRNVILEIREDELPEIPEKGYFWTDYICLNFLVQANNCLNIQLRNLLSLLDL